MARFNIKVEDCAWLWLEVEVDACSIEDAMKQAQQIAWCAEYEEWEYADTAIDKQRLIKMHDIDNDVEVSLFDDDVEDYIQSRMFSRECNSLCDKPTLVQKAYERRLSAKFGEKTAAASNRRHKGRRL